jgi:cytosine/uracil/thiamine/allantoin permease
MSFAERTIWAEIVTTLAVIALFVWLILRAHATGRFDGPDGLVLWARQVLWMIPAGILVAILVSVIMAVGYRAITGEDPDDLTDERDRAIAALGWQVTAIAASAGFLAALAGLAMGASTFAALNGMLAAFALSDTAGNLAKLIRYRLDRRGGA